MPTDGESRRARNRLRTYRALESAALELFVAQGYEQTTVEQIADRADVSLRTFFRYFATKDQTLFNGLPPTTAELRRQLQLRSDAEDPWTKLREAYCAVARERTDAELATIKLRYHLIRSTPALFARHAEHSRLEQDEIIGVLADEDRGGTSPELKLLVSAAYAIIWCALDEWVSTNKDEGLAAILDQAFRSLQAALCPDL